MNCWEYWNCPQDVKINCPASMLDMGEQCWTFQHDDRSNCPPVMELKITKCGDCPFFKEHYK